MQQIVMVFAVLTSFIVTTVGTTAEGNQAGAKTPSRRWELTQVDVMARRNWKSEEISVLGLRLGMSRTEAIEIAQKHKLDLIAATLADMAPCAVSKCELCHKDICTGVGLQFASDDRVEAIHVMRPLREASPDIRKASITKQFKGQTYLFFHSYSDELRLKLFGEETSKVETTSDRSTKYVYPNLGVELYVSLSGNKRIPESAADLIINFIPHAKSDARVPKTSP